MSDQASKTKAIMQEQQVYSPRYMPMHAVRMHYGQRQAGAVLVPVRSESQRRAEWIRQQQCG